MALLSSKRRTPASVRLVAAIEGERVPHTGTVRSVQEAEVTLPGGVLEEVWSPEYLERLARAYWLHLNRATFGLIRIVYGADFRAAVLLSRHLPLLRFHAPDYQASATTGSVTWRIERGLLVARQGRDRGFLRIQVERDRETASPTGTETVAVRLEVRNFYPWLRGRGRFARTGAWLYGQTQLRIHVAVGNAFLRSLARLELPPSRVGALPGEIEAPPIRR
jgi:hypothetical protein